MPNRPNESMESVAEALAGKRIKEIFKKAEIVADLHTTLTSKRGNYFRKQVLHCLGEGGDLTLFDHLRNEAGLEEYGRHIRKLLKFQLVQRLPEQSKEIYVRTSSGEEAINAVRGLERNIGTEEARRIYDASLGPYSIQLFLRVYGDGREPDFASRKIKYRPQEVGQLTYFLPRTVDGLAAIDKLNEAGLLSYEEDGNVYVLPMVLRGFYRYIADLYETLIGSGLLEKHR